MSYQDRLKTPSYTSPSGVTFEFLYEDVSIQSEKKTGVFLFPEVDGQYVQDRGRGGRKFPMKILFSGPDYDLQADSFLEALEERGIGTLVHPRYGTRKVVSSGTITQRDDLVTAANQAAFSFTFFETIVDINFPSSQVNDETDIENSVNDFNENISDQYANDLVIENEIENIILQDDLITKKDFFVESLSSITQLNEDIDNAINTISNSIDTTVLDLITQPGGIASQILTLINTPSNVATSAIAQIEGYGTVINNIISTTIDSIGKYYNALLFLSGSIGGVSLVMLNSEFTNRPQAIEALERITDFYDDITTWTDDNITNLEIQDTGDIYDSMNNIFSKIVGYLVRLSFDLPKKVYITLQEDRQLIELVSELYNDPEMIDFFITTNDLTTDEIELLPQGKEVVYFE